MKGNKHMETIIKMSCRAFALFVLACFAAAAGVLGAESIDEGLNLPGQSDIVNVSPELAASVDLGVHETQTVLGLYNSSTHQIRLWYMNNNVHVGTAYPWLVPAGWSPVSAADFNGDGHIDILFFNPTTRQTRIGYLDGITQLTDDYGPTLPSGWQVVGAADFNQDGHPDFLLLNSHQTAIWYMNNNIHIGTASGPTLPAFYGGLVAVSDFNGDGKPDYLLIKTTGLPTLIWYMHNNVHVGSAWGPTIPLPSIAQQAWALAGATDFNRNGTADYLLYRPYTHDTAIWYMRNNVVVGGASGPNIPSGYNLFAP